MWMRLRFFDNPGAHGPHMEAAREFYKQAHNFAVNNVEQLAGFQKDLTLEITYRRAKFLWILASEGTREEACGILCEGIQSAKDRLCRSQSGREGIAKWVRIKKIDLYRQRRWPAASRAQVSANLNRLRLMR